VERGDPVSLQRHHAVAAGVLHRANNDPAYHIRAIGAGIGQQAGKVEIQQRIAVAEQKTLVQKVPGMAQRAAGARPHRLARQHDAHRARQQRRQPGQCLFHPLGQMAGQQHDLLHPEPGDLAQQPGQERPIADRQQGLGRIGGQLAQPGAQPAHQHGALPHGGPPKHIGPLAIGHHREHPAGGVGKLVICVSMARPAQRLVTAAKGY